MCGLAGFAAIDGTRPLDSGPIRTMLRCIAHRGPDDEGVHEETGIVLGHRRLSIIDVAGGHQPLMGRDERTVLVCNGEVYNFRELRRELEQADHRFRTNSDTEVAAHAYDAWGLDFLDRLDGMFALALWDGAERRLVLARDRMGEKPLFWTVADGLLVFGSELSAILAHPAVGASIDPIALSAYLALEYVPAPASIVGGVHKLEPGHVLVLEDGRVRERAYWQLDPRPRTNLSYGDAVRQLRARLEHAVKSRLMSDVPLGVFLSGGIDSTAVAAIAARSGALETFSIGFEEASFDESRYAREAAQRIGSRHHEQLVRATDAAALAPGLGQLLDEPLGDSSVLPTLLLARFARQSVTVALGGDGGDELFAGYYMHQAHRLTGLARAVPGPVYGAMSAVAGRLPVSHRNFSLGFRAQRFLRGAAAPPPANHAYWMAPFTPAEQLALLAPDVAEAAAGGAHALDAFRTAWAHSEGLPPIARATHLDALTYLPNDILAKVDRASMSVALEVRAPFLAQAVVEFAFSLPDRYRMRGLTGKRILRDAVRDLVPDSVLARSKKGFGMPVGAWLNGGLRELADDMLSADRIRAGGLFRPQEVQRLLREHRAHKADHRKALWTLLVFELWREAKLGAGAALELVGPAAS